MNPDRRTYIVSTVCSLWAFWLGSVWGKISPFWKKEPDAWVACFRYHTTGYENWHVFHASCEYRDNSGNLISPEQAAKQYIKNNNEFFASLYTAFCFPIHKG